VQAALVTPLPLPDDGRQWPWWNVRAWAWWLVGRSNPFTGKPACGRWAQRLYYAEKFLRLRP